MTLPTKSQIRWQCRRGMLELDFLLERFINTQFDRLSDDDKKQLARLLTYDDPILSQWLFAMQEPVDTELKRLIDLIK